MGRVLSVVISKLVMACNDDTRRLLLSTTAGSKVPDLALNDSAKLSAYGVAMNLDLISGLFFLKSRNLSANLRHPLTRTKPQR